MNENNMFGPSDPTWFYACAIVRDLDTGRLLLEHRTDDAPVNPGQWGFFGGGAEPRESPEACLLRELKEELDVTLQVSDLSAWTSYVNPRTSRRRHVFEVTAIRESSALAHTEGAGLGWVDVESAFQLGLSTSTRRDLEAYARGAIAVEPAVGADARAARLPNRSTDSPLEIPCAPCKVVR